MCEQAGLGILYVFYVYGTQVRLKSGYVDVECCFEAGLLHVCSMIEWCSRVDMDIPYFEGAQATFLRRYHKLLFPFSVLFTVRYIQDNSRRIPFPSPLLPLALAWLSGFVCRRGISTPALPNTKHTFCFGIVKRSYMGMALFLKPVHVCANLKGAPRGKKGYSSHLASLMGHRFSFLFAFFFCRLCTMFCKGVFHTDSFVQI